MKTTETDISRLNARFSSDRLAHLRYLAQRAAFPPQTGETAEHIHTKYSFSPYTPSAAAYAARLAGFSRAGIVDHDTAAGAGEFIEACRALGMEPLLGLECRVSMADTPFCESRLNDPDQPGIAYMTLQRLTPEAAESLTRAFAPYREARYRRERAQTEKIAAMLPELQFSFEQSVLPLSYYGEGGTVTERHVLFALSQKLAERYGRGEALARKLSELCGGLSPEQQERLRDAASPYYIYDAAHMLKGGFTESFYIPASEECMTLSALSALSRETGALCCYAYLGDVTASVTGDKRPQAFEDAYLPELLDFMAASGVRAATHSRARNTAKQTERLLRLCRELGMETVEGADINSPRQSFRCNDKKRGL